MYCTASGESFSAFSNAKIADCNSYHRYVSILHLHETYSPLF